jgi:hypothetical protein
VAPKTAVNARNLEALGAARLAELLVEISAGNAAAKRRLRLELAAAKSPGDVAKEVRKRLATIARSRSFVDWQGVRALANDLDLQRSAVVETVAKTDATEALDLLWRLMALAPTVFDRSDDSSGTVIGMFRQACRDLGGVAASAGTDPTIFADRAYEALLVNDYGQFDELIRVLAPSLGKTGLEHLKQRMTDLSNRPIAKPAEKDRIKIGWLSSGPLYADDMAERSRVSTVRLALTEIADMQGDVEAFIAQYEEETRKVPKIAAEIAQRLLAAGRLEGDLGSRASARRRRPELAGFRVGERPDRSSRTARTRRGCPSRAMVLFRALALVKPAPGISQAASRFRRRRSGEGARSRETVRQLASGSVLSGLMACAGPRRGPGATTRRRAGRRSLRGPDTRG